MKTPLPHRDTFKTHDPDEARAVVAHAFCGHNLRVVDGALNMRTQSAALPHLSLHFLDYGAEVQINPEPLTSFYLLQIPLKGAARASARGIEVVSDPSTATLLDPDDRVAMQWASGAPHLCLRVDRQTLETKAARLVGRTLRDPLKFDLGVPMTTPEARSMRHYLDLLRTELDAERSLATRSVMAGQLEDLVMTSLLLSAPNTYSSWLEEDGGTATPRCVRKEVELIEAHAHEPLVVEDIAEAVGVSVRALQSGFRRHMGSSPMAYLRDVRFELVHKDLIDADPSEGVSVTQLALARGFTHLSRFAQAYRERYGVSPSDTLRS